jgi:hypothetical protein
MEINPDLRIEEREESTLHIDAKTKRIPTREEIDEGGGEQELTK